MRIIALESMDLSAAGAVLALRAGNSIDASEDIAVIAIKHGFAEPVDEAEVVPEPELEDDEGLDEAEWPGDLSTKAIEALEATDFGPEDIESTSDEELLALSGLGPAALRILREVFGGPPPDQQPAASGDR